MTLMIPRIITNIFLGFAVSLLSNYIIIGNNYEEAMY